jgi:hypothetical protein
VQQILDHVGAVQYADLETGKLTLKLLRGDYSVDDLPVFTYDNGIIAVQDDDSASTTSNPNEIVVTWNDPVTNSDGEVRAQNLGRYRIPDSTAVPSSIRRSPHTPSPPALPSATSKPPSLN